MSSNPLPPLNTFVLRFWWSTDTNNEEGLETRIWNAHIEHIQSGDSLGFRDIDMLLRFIEQFTGPLETSELPASGSRFIPKSG